MSALLGGSGSGSGPGTGRTIVTIDTTYYVATTGNDTTGTGTIGSPWRTIQHAVNYVMYNITAENCAITIQVADGTYAENLNLGPHQVFNTQGPFAFVPLINFSNVATPTNVVIAPTTNDNTEWPRPGTGAVIVCANAYWRLEGGFSITVGTSGNESGIGVFDAGQLDSWSGVIVFNDSVKIAFDVEYNSTLSLGSLNSGGVRFDSTVGSLVLVDHGATFDTYPSFDINFAGGDPGLNFGFYGGGLVTAKFGGGSNVTFRNTWSGATAATPTRSPIQQGTRVIDENTYLTEADYSVDYFNSWYNQGTGQLHFIKPASGTHLWEIGTESLPDGTPGDIYFWDYTQDIVPLSLGVDAGLGQVRTFIDGMFCWTNHSKYGGGGVVTTTLTQIAGGTVAVGSGASSNSSGSVSLARVTSPATTLVMEQTGASDGTTRLILKNASGANGAQFENAGLDLVDFAFLTSTSKQANVRFENRGGNLLDPANSSTGEFQFVEDAGGGLAGYFALGGSSLVLSGGQQITFGPPVSSTFPGIRSDGSTGVKVRLSDDSAYGPIWAQFARIPTVAIASLPGTPQAGDIATVNDALAPAIGVAVGAGGAAFAAVCWNGAQWTVFSI